MFTMLGLDTRSDLLTFGEVKRAGEIR